MAPLKARDVTFLELKPSVFCVECELISYNNTDRCLACGSRSVLSLSRVLGGSMRGEDCGRLVSSDYSERIVRDVLMHAGVDLNENAGQPYVSAAMRGVVEQAAKITRASGAALAVAREGKMVCVASVGENAPEVGAEVDVENGISGMCLRTARTLRCDHAERDAYVDVRRCRTLGVRSVVASPMTHMDKVLGLLEVLSPENFAFDDQHVAAVQSLASVMVMVMMRNAAEEKLQASVAPELASGLSLAM